MRILIALFVLIISCVYSQKVINTKIVYTEDFCSNGTPKPVPPKVFCPTGYQSWSGGLITKENQCVYIPHISTAPTTLTLSSDNQSVVKSEFALSDYYCANKTTSQETVSLNTCTQDCTQDAQLFKYEIDSVTDDLEVPSKSLLSISTSSDNCSEDWKNSFNFIYYYSLKTCVNDPIQGSFMLDCNSDSITVYSFDAQNCKSNVQISHIPLSQDCNKYQVCAN
ncbi:hypothetical protein DICPUDRAFT_152735 [Dictyostelium purpureum]|uniref:Uncharacterized protein n=1 Tax=Dictyostelium purpureum TaxID=5786 RepID=F0ZM55_DICPU|nr:uncharacterized protein DICPUDRAFT_152735 [Dictyostelium purpureum]EGC34967.1 hypothetical protein DICPUDRAFT_152735 [Dictyostelium purpureum]|eukprot:XP_003288492.1 hypothetical protein DICPUDRAFT_152735 [Dictyostelium purpureum]